MNKVEEYIKDRDILGVAHSATLSFVNCLSKEEIQNCIVNAIWKASKKYDKRHNTKFTSYLYNGVVMECLNQRKFNKNKSQKSVHLHLAIPDKTDYFSRFEMQDLVETCCDDPFLIYDRFYNGMSIAEIAKDRGLCGETIRIRIKKNLEKLKLELEKSV